MILPETWRLPVRFTSFKVGLYVKLLEPLTAFFSPSNCMEYMGPAEGGGLLLKRLPLESIATKLVFSGLSISGRLLRFMFEALTGPET